MGGGERGGRGEVVRVIVRMARDEEIVGKLEEEKEV